MFVQHTCNLSDSCPLCTPVISIVSGDGSIMRPPVGATPGPPFAHVASHVSLRRCRYTCPHWSKLENTSLRSQGLIIAWGEAAYCMPRLALGPLYEGRSLLYTWVCSGRRRQKNAKKGGKYAQKAWVFLKVVHVGIGDLANSAKLLIPSGDTLRAYLANLADSYYRVFWLVIVIAIIT